MNARQAFFGQKRVEMGRCVNPKGVVSNPVWGGERFSRNRRANELTLHAAFATRQREGTVQSSGGLCWVWYKGATSRGDRTLSGALCPAVNMVPGARGDIIGGALTRVPVWEIVSRSRPPALVASLWYTRPIYWRSP